MARPTKLNFLYELLLPIGKCCWMWVDFRTFFWAHPTLHSTLKTKIRVTVTVSKQHYFVQFVTKITFFYSLYQVRFRILRAFFRDLGSHIVVKNAKTGGNFWAREFPYTSLKKLIVPKKVSRIITSWVIRKNTA